MNGLLEIHVGDAREGLAKVEPGSCQVCISSPPYYGLRSYLKAGDANKALEIGKEQTPEDYIENLVGVFSEARRCLKDDGLIWLNLGDSYAAGRGGTQMPAETLAGGEGGKGDEDTHRGRLAQVPNNKNPHAPIDTYQPHRNASAIGLKHKDLVMIPSRVALAMQADGWYLRSMIPWIKRNPMPESVKDRPATAVEYVFLFSKSDRYYYNHDAVKMPYSDSTLREAHDGYDGEAIKEYEDTGAQNPSDTKRRIIESVRKKNIEGNMSERGVTRTTEGLNLKTMAEKCSSPFGRNLRNSDFFFQTWQGLIPDGNGDPMALVVNTHGFKGAHFATFPEKLVQPMILASTKPGDIVLDPFFGAGTTGVVALKLGRKAIGCELNTEFAEMAKQRCSMHMMETML